MTTAIAARSRVDVGCILRSLSRPSRNEDLVTAQDREVLRCLGGVASMRDGETGAHTARMASYSGAIAAAYGLPEVTVQALVAAAPLHDIGKVSVPDAILNKRGPLTPAEREQMKLHAQHGHDLLCSSSSVVLLLGAEIALSHHERWDGGGYPRGLAGAQIPLSGRIVAVADCFDALTTQRPYKRAWGVEESVRFICNDDGHFDPEVVDAFLQALPVILNLKRWYESISEVTGLPSAFTGFDQPMETLDCQVA